MAIGERIRFFRNLCGMTQKYLGQVVGFPKKTVDIRMAQYESGSRTPKADLTNKLAEVFDISPQALSVPDIDSYIGLMHTLFTLEDRYGLTIVKTENGVSMYADTHKGTDATELSECLMRGLNNPRNIITATLTVTNMTSGATIIRSMMKLPIL